MSWHGLLCLCLIGTACGLRPGGNSARHSNSKQETVAEANQPERGIFQNVNRERVAWGLEPLIWDSKTASVAREHSRNMATRWYFSHTDSNGREAGERLRKAGIQWRSVGENIYMHRDGEDTAETSVSGWMKSKGHRDNILNPNFTHTGVGVVTAADGTIYCTQDFRQPLSAAK